MIQNLGGPEGMPAAIKIASIAMWNVRAVLQSSNVFDKSCLVCGIDPR